MATKRLGRTQDPTILVLTSLTGGPKHGYSLIQDIEAMSGVRLGPGTLYGVLARLEEEGLVVALPAEDRRRPYKITAQGAAVLRERLETLSSVARLGLRRLGVAGSMRGASWIDAALAIYPTWWRTRYGDEVRAVSSDAIIGGQSPFRVTAGLLVGAVRLRVSGSEHTQTVPTLGQANPRLDHLHHAAGPRRTPALLPHLQAGTAGRVATGSLGRAHRVREGGVRRVRPPGRRRPPGHGCHHRFVHGPRRGAGTAPSRWTPEGAHPLDGGIVGGPRGGGRDGGGGCARSRRWHWASPLGSYHRDP